MDNDKRSKAHGRVMGPLDFIEQIRELEGERFDLQERLDAVTRELGEALADCGQAKHELAAAQQRIDELTAERDFALLTERGIAEAEQRGYDRGVAEGFARGEDLRAKLEQESNAWQLRYGDAKRSFDRLLREDNELAKAPMESEQLRRIRVSHVAAARTEGFAEAKAALCGIVDDWDADSLEGNMLLDAVLAKLRQLQPAQAAPSQAELDYSETDSGTLQSVGRPRPAGHDWCGQIKHSHAGCCNPPRSPKR